MTGKHHLVSGTVAGVCVGTSIFLSGYSNVLVVGGTILTTMIGSLFPDIDSSTSKLGSKIKLASKIISKLFGHRGFLHSPLFIVFMMWLMNYIFTKNDIVQYSYLWYGFSIGMINHLACDMMTKGGIPLLYPFSRLKFSFTWMKSGSKWEWLPLLIVCAFSIIFTVCLCYNHTFLPIPTKL